MAIEIGKQYTYHNSLADPNHPAALIWQDQLITVTKERHNPWGDDEKLYDITAPNGDPGTAWQNQLEGKG